MKDPITGGKVYFSYNLPNLIPNFSDEKNYAYDLLQQHRDLEAYWKGKIGHKKEEDYIEILGSNANTQNLEPLPTVLFLPGSEGDPLRFTQMIEDINKNNIQYISFKRNNDKNGSFSNQEKYPLSYEIIKIYQVCKFLVGLGVKDIILMGHSLGGILTLQCALEQNALAFRNIEYLNNQGGVRGYFALSALPFAMKKLTSSEPVHIMHGINDTYCKYSVMKHYYDLFCKDQPNVVMHSENGDHEIINSEWSRSWSSLFDMMGYVCASNQKNWIKKGSQICKILFQYCTKKEIIIEALEEFQDFNETCAVIDGDEFFPLKKETAAYPLKEMPEYIKNNMKPSITLNLQIQTKESIEERDKKIIRIVSNFFPSLNHA